LKRRGLTGLLTAGILVASVAWQACATDVPGYITAAIADQRRAPLQTALDEARKPAQILSVVGLKPGDRIVDFIPGLYWDRLFSDIVGPAGHVYMFYPKEYPDFKIPVIPSDVLLPSFNNVSVYTGPVNTFTTPEPVDVVWMRQNYHDLYDKFMGPADVPAINKAVYKALKPGGLYVIIDHAAKDGTGIGATETLHRIDPAVVKRDLAAAGFVFVAESSLLRNPDDPQDQLSYAPSIIGKSDQFFYVFRKP